MSRYANREIKPASVQRSTHTPDTHHHTVTPQLETGGLHDLQRLLGNQGVQRMLAANPSLGQAKLTVGAADDAYEQEADRVASEVMSAQGPVGGGDAGVQRAAEEDDMAMKRADVQRDAEEDDMAMKRAPDIMQRAPEDEIQGKRDIQREAAPEEEMAMKRAPDIVQRGAMGEDDEVAAKRIQRAAANDGLMGSFDVEGDLENQIQSQKGGGNALDTGDQSFFESRFGQDFSDVKVHTGGDSDAINRSIGARAFTNGSDVFMRGGEYSPGSSSSRELLAHELTHVVQQTGSKPIQPKRDEHCDGC